MPVCLVSFGSNLGDREATLRRALSSLEEVPGYRSAATSSFLETTPIGGEQGQGAFLNGVVRFDCQLSAEELHSELRSIEKQLGRERHERWSARTLDLDLIGYGNQIINKKELRVPHPRMSFRSFVLQPACEVAPDWIHPELSVSLEELQEVLTKGRHVVQVVGSIEPLVEAELSLMGHDVLVERVNCPKPVAEPTATPAAESTEDSVSKKARLLIDASLQGVSRGVPRLRLADCSADSWRTEVRAALECVWPMCDNGH